MTTVSASIILEDLSVLANSESDTSHCFKQSDMKWDNHLGELPSI